jgi:hypothetical protein
MNGHNGPRDMLTGGCELQLIPSPQLMSDLHHSISKISYNSHVVYDVWYFEAHCGIAFVGCIHYHTGNKICCVAIQVLCGHGGCALYLVLLLGIFRMVPHPCALLLPRGRTALQKKEGNL